MTILIVQGPHTAGHFAGGDLSARFDSLMRAAGQDMSVCTCGGLRELVARVREAKAEGAEFMLLAPGNPAEEARAHPEAGLDEALEALASPYVEVHDDSGAVVERADGRHGAPLATIVINGDLATSYRIALGIALRQLAA